MGRYTSNPYRVPIYVKLQGQGTCTLYDADALAVPQLVGPPWPSSARHWPYLSPSHPFLAPGRVVWRGLVQEPARSQPVLPASQPDCQSKHLHAVGSTLTWTHALQNNTAVTITPKTATPSSYPLTYTHSHPVLFPSLPLAPPFSSSSPPPPASYTSPSLFPRVCCV